MPFCFLIQNFAEIGQSVDELWPKNRFSRWRPPPSWILKITIFGHAAVIGFNIWCSITSFNKIRQFFTEICLFNDFQNGSGPPSSILKICSFCHAARIDMPFCFLVQNFAEIEQLVDKLWRKKRFSRWRSLPSSLLKISIFAHVTVNGFNIWCSIPTVMFDHFLHQHVSGSLPSYGHRFNVGDHWKPWERCRMHSTRDETHGTVQLHINPTSMSTARPDWDTVLCCSIPKRQSRWLQTVSTGTPGRSG